MLVKWLQWGEWIERTYSTFFQPKLQACVICQGWILTIPASSSHPLPMHQQRLLSLLCRRCVATIPWIKALGCAHCGRTIRCPDCLHRPLQKDGLRANRSVVAYNKQMKRWLSQYKFKGYRDYESVIINMMLYRYKSLMASVWCNKSLNNNRVVPFLCRRDTAGVLPDLITYVPTTPKRIYERGFNQAEQLAKSLGKKWNIPVIQLIDRVQDSGKQSKQSRRDRERSIDKAFVIHHSAQRELQQNLKTMGRKGVDDQEKIRLLLIDDVYTTGSTLRACSRLLESLFILNGYSSSIVSYTWARA